MTQEEFYDNEVAPALMQLAEACKKRGLTFVAHVGYLRAESGVEHEEGEPDWGAGTTSVAPEAGDLPPSYLLTRTAAMANGNIDKLVFALVRYIRSEGKSHSSLILEAAGLKPLPEDRT